MNFRLENFTILYLSLRGQTVQLFFRLTIGGIEKAVYTFMNSGMQEIVALGLNQGKARKLEKTVTNHFNLSSITGFLVKFALNAPAVIFVLHVSIIFLVSEVGSAHS